MSVLPVFSKFLENVVYKRLYNFLIKYNILFDNQYGFRKNHSTALALLHLYDKLANAIDNKEYTMVCLLTCPWRLTRSVTRFY